MRPSTILNTSSESANLGKRVLVVGTMGSGKTTMARGLAEKLHVPHIELDDFFWGPNWTQCPTPEFRQLAAEALSADCWVADGNHGEVRDIAWGRADTLVWLDYPATLVLFRLLRRTLKRMVRNEELWAGNREAIGNVIDRKTLFFWVFSHHRQKRREYPALLAQAEFAHLRLSRLRSPRDAELLLQPGDQS